MALVQDGQAVDAALGARLARRFGRDARRLADAAGVILVTADLRARTLLFTPAPFPGGMAAAAIPAGTPEPIASVMIAVAVALHLDGGHGPVAYLDGALDDEQPRHRQAHAFARAFVREAGTEQPRRAPSPLERAG